MKTRHPHLNSLWADLMVEELIRSGADSFCLSPGSRSTPLVAAVATNPRARHIMHFDERGAAFCALGYGRATGRPAVLICTSGTAAANYYPAVIEAATDHVPLLVLTADRPPELRATGANQTIDQVKMFGPYPRWFFDLPCPSQDITPEFVLTTIDHAVYRAEHGSAGPVHLNCMYREPLAPIGPDVDFSTYLRPVEHWHADEIPYTQYHPPVTIADPARFEEAARLINGAQRGIIVAGRLRSYAACSAVTNLANKLGWPVLADISSGLRLGCRNSTIISCADLALGSKEFAGAHAPNTVLHFGPALTSKRLNQWLAGVRPATYIHVTEYPERDDPDHQVTHRYHSDIETFCNFLQPFATGVTSEDNLIGWQKASIEAESAINQILSASGPISEPHVARLVSRHIADTASLFLASSMPIRDMDRFAAPDGPWVPVVGNRGASGIDGIVASAVGYSIGHSRRCTLIIGDLALLHDLNSLALARLAPEPMTIVAINNNGGGIFHFLPIAERTDLFEMFWGTPHGFTFERAAAMFGLDYHTPTTAAEFEQTFRNSQSSDQSTLIEVRTDRTANQQLHRTITTAVTDSMSQ